ncbi:recombination mediator RecR [Metallumcola ferriviriculae]|uniref:Recombination protein RecR n=2 Tax=Metallumcola ferriviriculae TaxID=3039180 RepID=A0AAU0UIC7_9FIRM|nr:recombination mediator RecR [Desulfitibacteraceae bacterium MK1]
MHHAQSIARLITELGKLPGVGPKTAQRLTYHLLNSPRENSLALSKAIREAVDKVTYCSVCSNFTDIDPCFICRDEKRDKSIICVVEEPGDIVAIEKTREYKGHYHVLQGIISPIDGIGPEQLKVKELLARITHQPKDNLEVIIALGSSVEGEATSMYLAKILRPLGIKVTRIAHGLPVGGALEYADEVTLAKAFEGRIELF